jgi:hypothetical protein
VSLERGKAKVTGSQIRKHNLNITVPVSLMTASQPNRNISHSGGPVVPNNRVCFTTGPVFTLETNTHPQKYPEAQAARIAQRLAQIRQTLEEFVALDNGSPQ